MTDDEFKIFRDLINKECGIFLNDEKKAFLKARVERRIRALNIGSFFQYYKYITDCRNADEFRTFIDSVTINETYFFRNMPQFDMLREKVLPELATRKRKQRDYALSVWSAGCATGEEPYSIAMEVTETIPDAPLWNIKIIASDISLRCLVIAHKGKYPSEKMKEVPVSYKERCFKQAGEQFEVKENIRKFVMFDYHNLMHENGLSNVDVIFCRNVMIYFAFDEQKRMVERFFKALKIGGYLFLGHAESLHGITTNGNFRFHFWNKGTVYQKVEETHERV